MKKILGCLAVLFLLSACSSNNSSQLSVSNDYPHYQHSGGFCSPAKVRDDKC